MHDAHTVAPADWRPAVGDLVWVQARVVERPGMVAEPSISLETEWVEFDLIPGGPRLDVTLPIPLKSMQPGPPPTGPPAPTDPLT